MFEMLLKIQDNATKLAQQRLEATTKAHFSALKAAAFRLMKVTKEGMRIQAPGDTV